MLLSCISYPIFSHFPFISRIFVFYRRSPSLLTCIVSLFGHCSWDLNCSLFFCDGMKNNSKTSLDEHIFILRQSLLIVTNGELRTQVEHKFCSTFHLQLMNRSPVFSQCCLITWLLVQLQTRIQDNSKNHSNRWITISFYPLNDLKLFRITCITGL